MKNQEQHLETILRNRGLGWAVDLFAPSSRAAAHYLEDLKRLERYIEEHSLGKSSFSPESLEQLVSVSPYKADAFLQALVSIRSTPILCAAWRIIQGMEIECVEMRGTRLADFALRVVLRSPYETEEEYKSDHIGDVVFVRHLSASTLNGRPYFHGFYPLRQT
jgi:hypothetical protein